jgi:hypothetical protein
LLRCWNFFNYDWSIMISDHLISLCTAKARLTIVQSAKGGGSWNWSSRLSPPLLAMHWRCRRIRHLNSVGTSLWCNRRWNRAVPNEIHEEQLSELELLVASPPIAWTCHLLI